MGLVELISQGLNELNDGDALVIKRVDGEPNGYQLGFLYRTVHRRTKLRHPIDSLADYARGEVGEGS